MCNMHINIFTDIFGQRLMAFIAILITEPAIFFRADLCKITKSSTYVKSLSHQNRGGRNNFYGFLLIQLSSAIALKPRRKN